jgi:hypothetical protein
MQMWIAPLCDEVAVVEKRLTPSGYRASIVAQGPFCEVVEDENVDEETKALLKDAQKQVTGTGDGEAQHEEEPEWVDENQLGGDEERQVPAGCQGAVNGDGNAVSLRRAIVAVARRSIPFVFYFFVFNRGV